MRFLLERRHRRSADRKTALRFQLEHSRTSGGLEAIVLADLDGLEVGSAGDSSLCRELAAYAPLVGQSVLGVPLPPLLQGADLDVRPLKLHGRSYFLACLGGTAARDLLLRDSIDGVSRILATN